MPGSWDETGGLSRGLKAPVIHVSQGPAAGGACGGPRRAVGSWGPPCSEHRSPGGPALGSDARKRAPV